MFLRGLHFWCWWSCCEGGGGADEEGGGGGVTLVAFSEVLSSEEVFGSLGSLEAFPREMGPDFDVGNVASGSGDVGGARAA